MKSKSWFLFCISCICVSMYLCWNLGAMTSQPRFRIFCQQSMKELGHNRMIGKLSEMKAEPPMSATSKRTLPAFSTTRLYSSKTRDDDFIPNSELYSTLVNGNDINLHIEKHFTMLANETKDPFINLHRYSFTHSSDKCSRGSLFLIIVVHSAPMNKNKRDLIRTSFGSVESYRDNRLAVVFCLGAVRQQSVHESINRESQHYNDIVQGNFLDSYKSLNRKHIMAMHWVTLNCNPRYILKLDDDTFVNPYRIIDFLLIANPLGMTMHCKIISGDPPNRRKKSKWYTSVSQYPFPVLPPFCLGFAYITTPTAWSAMYKASETYRLMDMDDVYVSGVLATKVGVEKRNFENLLYSCPTDSSRMTERALNVKAIVLDRRNKCRDIPFTFWPKLQEMNNID
ncbi:beta-1,3-galactosyltransferase 1-like [Haliotis rufescens]|uniref:beta-1,3-galactosyltransferase 1-like n=1 Tax=Haliotis rufescens TaxID=6454 RepID=UPI00201E80C1|nr:beta-1,3-galactosyltransferase 1-like [Haliotis rufescens]